MFRGCWEQERSAHKTRTGQELADTCSVSFRSLRAVLRQFEPVPLINERNRQQQRSEHNEAQNAITAFELRNIVREYFHRGDCNEDQRLPAHKRAALPE